MAPMADAMPRKARHATAPSCLYRPVCAPVAAEPVTFTDHEGRKVTLPAPAQRIASIPIPMASTLIAIDGATDRLVGMNPTAKSAIMEGILGRIFPEARAAGLADEGRPSVLCLLRAMDNLRASGTENNCNAWYHMLAGGRDAAEDMVGGWVDINVEQVAAWNPDVIFLNSFEAGLTLDRIMNDPILSLTSAAQSGCVYKMPLGRYRSPPNQESPLTWMWTANLLHPDLFDYDLRAEMRTAYQVPYGHDLTDADIDESLWARA